MTIFSASFQDNVKLWDTLTRMLHCGMQPLNAININLITIQLNQLRCNQQQRRNAKGTACGGDSKNVSEIN